MSENNDDPHTNGEHRFLRGFSVPLDIIFDVGANVGDWTAQALETMPSLGKVYAFEPCDSTHKVLALRSFPPKVKLFQSAMSSECGKARLYMFENDCGMNSFYQRNDARRATDLNRLPDYQEVQRETIDGFCAANHIETIDLLKIDTEGHEVDVLHGAVLSLSEGRIRCAQFEYGGTYIDSRHLLKDIFELVVPYGYVIFLIAPDGLIAYPSYDRRLENFAYKNFVMFHKHHIKMHTAAEAALRDVRSKATKPTNG